MKNKWLVITVLFPMLSFSQEKTAKTRVNTITSAGLIAGESTAKPLVQVSAGLRYDRWFTGIGIGLDPYKFNSIPLFADGRVSFGKTGLTFLYAQGGYNFSYDNSSDPGNDFFKTTDRFYGGLYFDAGVGYRIPTKSSWHRVLFSAGYSQKKLVNKVGYTFPCITGNCPEEIYKYHYNLGRIMAKVSWEFGR